MLTDLKLKALKAKDKPYKVADRDGLYAPRTVLCQRCGTLNLG